MMCLVGVRCYKVHLLCGGIMRLMSLLQLTINRYAVQLRLTYVQLLHPLVLFVRWLLFCQVLVSICTFSKEWLKICCCICLFE